MTLRRHPVERCKFDTPLCCSTADFQVSIPFSDVRNSQTVNLFQQISSWTRKSTRSSNGHKELKVKIRIFESEKYNKCLVIGYLRDSFLESSCFLDFPFFVIKSIQITWTHCFKFLIRALVFRFSQVQIVSLSTEAGGRIATKTANIYHRFSVWYSFSYYWPHSSNKQVSVISVVRRLISSR